MSGEMSADAILDRARSICANATFGMTEAQSWASFDLQPTTNIDLVFRIPPPSSGHIKGGFSFTEERTDQMQIWVARRTNQDYAAVRRALVRDMHSLTAAIVRDAAEISGDYHVPDLGRGHAISEDNQGNEYVVLRLSLPINYMTQL